ncbi:type VI secretion system-associated FHA domain protein TagH [Xenorhabdus sp. PB62.4]|uniref:type VI secretion system-associated FHA domain protein TagH n=1 Tax=Xenorhabdus sp. PB62.4 TaxID=1851573 RepID=UPI001CA3B22A|nr:type VI secretion system-associated FHA domain protein TagH [Xenorhabdus sp. PB62.4]MBC8953433.1 putative FHA domain protein [Xenorhabdus sp. PB62.4]
MRFTIVKNTGTNQPPQLSYDFTPPGGTIGRSTDNNWVLPDEEQAIARLQAIVSISSDGECRMINRGTASEISLNTIPMAPDRQVEVCDGDMLNIGDYQIQVVNIKQSTPPSATTRTLNTTESSNNKPGDIPNEVWDGLENIFTPTETTLAQTTPLNDDNPLIKPQQHQERNPIDPLEQMETTIDLDSLQFRATDPITMFNPDTDFQQENILNDTTPSALLQQSNQYGNQNNKQEIDPLVLFANKHTQGNIKNDDPLNLMLNNAEPLAPLDNITEEITKNSVKNPSDTELQNQNYYQEPVNYQDHSFRHDNNSKNDESVGERLDIDPITYTPHPHQTDEVKLEGKFLEALLNGMGLNYIQQPQFDEHKIYQLGKLVSQLSQGIMALNASRTLLKHKTDADMTQVLADANNPFKLLPSGQAVLVQMFGNQMPGFMSPEQATRDILIELQAHQLGMIAGLRTITADILQLFDPNVIEQKAHKEGGFPRLSLTSTYKAALWDYLAKHYQKTVHKLDQDDALFGKNFLQAYEAEIHRYKCSQNKPNK